MGDLSFRVSSKADPSEEVILMGKEAPD